MPISFNPDTNQTTIEFAGGDMIAGLCGNENGEVDSVGISEAYIPGKSGDLASGDSCSDPSVLLSFSTREALESFIAVLTDFRDEKFT